MNKKTYAHLALILVAIIYGANYSIAKIAMDEPSISPMAMIFMRLGTGVITFTTIYFFWVRENIDRKDLPIFAFCGLTGAALNMSFFFIGLNFTNPINASLVMTSSPVMVIIFSYFIIKEKITAVNGIGIFMALIGAAILIYRPTSTEQAGSMLGDFFIFMNATSYALYLVLVKRLIAKYHPFTILLMVFSFGFLFVLPFSIKPFLFIEWEGLDWTVMGSIVFVLIGTTILAYLFNAFALVHVRSSTAGSYIYAQPVVASFFAILMQKDSLQPKMIFCSALIFIGLYLVSKKKKSISKSFLHST